MQILHLLQLLASRTNKKEPEVISVHPLDKCRRLTFVACFEFESLQNEVNTAY